MLFDVVLALYLAVVIGIYFVPAMLAWKAVHRTAICVLNIAIAWTGIGWIALVIWALIADPRPEPSLARPAA